MQGCEVITGLAECRKEMVNEREEIEGSGEIWDRGKERAQGFVVTINVGRKRERMRQREG